MVLFDDDDDEKQLRMYSVTNGKYGLSKSFMIGKSESVIAWLLISIIAASGTGCFESIEYFRQDTMCQSNGI